MTYKGVFFDLYGTLLIYGDMSAAWADWLSILHTGLVEQGLSISKEALGQSIDGFFTQPEPPYQADGLTIFERRLRVLGLKLSSVHYRIGKSTLYAGR